MENPADNAYEPDIIRLPFPADFDDQSYESVAARASALIGAAEAIFQKATESGQVVHITEADKTISRDVFDGSKPLSTIQTTAEGIHLTALLNAYDITVVQNAQQLRNFCTNILIDKAAAGKTETVQLRAVEMLGKIKDVALFEERSTILVQNMSTEQIKAALKDKVAALRSRVTEAIDVESK